MEKQEQSTFMQTYLTPIAVLLGAVILAFAYVYGSNGTTGTTDSKGNTEAAAPTVDIKDIKTEGEPMIGDANAPITIAVFFDYQCPFCKLFDQQVASKLYDTYVKNGTVKIVFKDMQFLGDDSTTAALFARALWDVYPNRFYEWYQAMFAAQDDEGDKGFGDLPSIVTLTQGLGIDSDKVVAQMNTHKAEYQQKIDADRSEAASMGVNGTPSIIVGKQLYTGMSAEEFMAKIEAEIKAEEK